MSDNRQRQIDLVLMRTARYYGVELAEDILDLYHSSLAEFSTDVIAKAFTKHVKSSKWFPKISEIIALVKPSAPKLESVAEQQATHVLAMISRLGYRNETG